MPFTNMVGNGGLLSTMSDLLAWNENLDNPKIGGRAYVTTMETPMRLTNGRAITYALGLIVAPYGGVREVSHSGSTAGYQTFLARYPEQHVSVAVWCNAAGVNPTPLAHQVADLVLAKPSRSVAQAGSPVLHVSAGDLGKWPGTYADRFSDQLVTVSAENLAAVANGSGPKDGGALNALRGDVSFSGAAPHRVLTIARPDGDTAVYREVRPASVALRLADYTGTYASDELDVRLVIVAKDGKLVLRRRPADEFELRPAYADDFRSGGGLGTLRFARDRTGAVTGFSIYAGRVLDVRFKRVSR
jgi:hypothetical protein